MTILNEYSEPNFFPVFFAIAFGALALIMLFKTIDLITEKGRRSTILKFIAIFICSVIVCLGLSLYSNKFPVHYIECTLNQDTTFTAEDMQKYKLKRQRGEIYVYEVLPEKK